MSGSAVSGIPPTASSARRSTRMHAADAPSIGVAGPLRVVGAAPASGARRIGTPSAASTTSPTARTRPSCGVARDAARSGCTAVGTAAVTVWPSTASARRASQWGSSAAVLASIRHSRSASSAPGMRARARRRGLAPFDRDRHHRPLERGGRRQRCQVREQSSPVGTPLLAVRRGATCERWRVRRCSGWSPRPHGSIGGRAPPRTPRGGGAPRAGPTTRPGVLRHLRCSCGCDLVAAAPTLRPSKVERSSVHRSGLRDLRRRHCPGRRICAWLLMRLRPRRCGSDPAALPRRALVGTPFGPPGSPPGPALDRPCDGADTVRAASMRLRAAALHRGIDFARTSGPPLCTWTGSAPGCSCGCDLVAAAPTLRPSHVERSSVHRSGLRDLRRARPSIACATAPTLSGPRRCGFELRPSIAGSTLLEPPGLRSAPGPDLRLVAHSSSTSPSARSKSRGWGTGDRSARPR